MLKILVPNEGEAAYRRAGVAFQDMYALVTGGKPDIIDAYEPGYDLVVIGSDAVNDFAAQAFSSDWIDSFSIRYGTDDYAMRSVEADGHTYLFLAGGRGRSTIYAVYDYFERVAGCHYFWDGDVIPHHDTLPLGGLSVTEKPRFTYRGLRYFAHRGLHRFQAEHWSLEDWKREIDWMLKRRLNYFMLRIGEDDVFQRAFPDIVDYPSATERLPEAMDGYDDRTLFWPLEYRSHIRKKLMEYAFACDLMHSEDCGTMTHWYSRTPIQFLESKKPKFLSQSDRQYAHATSYCWDLREKENLDNYMKITDVYANYYGKPELFHTIGLAERNMYADRHKNLNLKLYTYRRILQRIRESYPMSKMLIASWDFIGWWQPDEVRRLVSELDPERTIILDYTSEHPDPGPTFLNWGVVGKFPWIFGLFHAFEAQSDIRAPYDTSRERLMVAKDDPYCKGMIFWPELSHSDTLVLEYLSRNSWQPDQLTIEPLAADFTKCRYGKFADELNRIWQSFLPIVKLVSWSSFCRLPKDDPEYVKYARDWWDDRVFIMDMLNVQSLKQPSQDDIRRYRYQLEQAKQPASHAFEILEMIAALPAEALEDEFIRRDITDISRTLYERISHWGIMKLCVLRDEFVRGADNEAEIHELIGRLRQWSQAELAVLRSHDDYSMYKTLTRLQSVCPVNPIYETTLKRNLVNGYCRQACYEPYKYLFLPEQEVYYDWVLRQVDAGNRGEWHFGLEETERALYENFLNIPLSDMYFDRTGE